MELKQGFGEPIECASVGSIDRGGDSSSEGMHAMEKNPIKH